MRSQIQIRSVMPVAALLIYCLLLTNGCSPATSPAISPATATNASTPAQAATLALSSTAFRSGEKIPSKYTCQGDNVSPPLAWTGATTGAQSLALITEDIDGPSGIITHWIIFNIPANTRELAEAVPAQAQLASGALQGNNVRGQPAYTGPCPPPGTTHRYEFTLFALDQTLNLKSGVARAEFIAALQGHTVAVAQLMGIYQR